MPPHSITPSSSTFGHLKETQSYSSAYKLVTNMHAVYSKSK